MSKTKFLGANVGAMVVLPFANASIEAPAFQFGQALDTGTADMLVRPIDLGWHSKRADVVAGFQVYIPTGRYEPGADDNLGKGMWTYEPFLGTTVFFDEKKTLSLAATAYWEFHGNKEDSDVKVGQILTPPGRARQVVPRRRADHRRGVLRPVEGHQGSTERVRTARRRRDRAGFPQQAQGLRLRAGRDAADRHQVEALRPGQRPLSLGDRRAREDARTVAAHHRDLPGSEREAEMSAGEANRGRRFMKATAIRTNIEHVKNAITAGVGLALIVTTMTASAQAQTTDTRLGKAELREWISDRGDDAEALRRDGLPARRASLPVGLSGGFVRIDPARDQARPRRRSQRPGHRRQLRRPQGPSGSRRTTPRSTPWPTSILRKSGPVVVEIPPGAIVGIIDDFWQRSITDVGLPGPDGDKGGKFLLLPPGHKGEVPQTGYHVLAGTMNNYNVMVRGIVENNDKDCAVAERQEGQGLSAERTRQSQTEQVHVHVRKGDRYDFRRAASSSGSGSPRSSTTTPLQERDRFFMAMLKPLGIEKGKPFKPDARQRAILEDAARIGDAMGRVMLFDGPTDAHRARLRTPFPGIEVALGVLR